MDACMCCQIFYYFINSITMVLYLSWLVTHLNSFMFYCDNKTRLQYLSLSGTRSKSSLSVADFIFYQEHIFKLFHWETLCLLAKAQPAAARHAYISSIGDSLSEELKFSCSGVWVNTIHCIAHAALISFQRTVGNGAPHRAH